MIGAFNSVYTALQGFFSRTFWFATFLPVTMFAILHALIAGLTVGPVTVFGVTVSLDKDLTQIAAAAPFIIIILVVTAYALLPLMPRLRGLLDGSLLPAALHDWLRRMRLIEIDKARQQVHSALQDQGKVAALFRNVSADSERLRTAYRAGQALGTAPDGGLVETAEKAVAELKKAIFAAGALYEPGKKALDAVVAALAANNPDPERLRTLMNTPGPTVPMRQLSERTNAVSDLLEEVMRDAKRETEYRYQILQTRSRVAGALKNIRATSVGDARLVVERYAYDVYQVDFDYLWPRLLVAMKAEKSDDPVLDSIEVARSKVDFAVLSIALATSIPAVWLPVLIARGGPAWLFLVIAAATPVALAFFYQLVFESQLAFGEVVKTAIDKYRFLVFKMLRLPNPITRSEERALWNIIARAEEDSRTAEIVYSSAPPQG